MHKSTDCLPHSERIRIHIIIKITTQLSERSESEHGSLWQAVECSRELVVSELLTVVLNCHMSAEIVNTKWPPSKLYIDIRWHLQHNHLFFICTAVSYDTCRCDWILKGSLKFGRDALEEIRINKKKKTHFLCSVLGLLYKSWPMLKVAIFPHRILNIHTFIFDCRYNFCF